MLKIYRCLSVVGFLIILYSCSFHNRMTSPVVLEKKEHIGTFGVSVDPLELLGEGIIDSYLAIAQPVIGYRTGLGKRQELGITLYGVFTPGFVIDYKHNFYQKEKFLVTGDLAIFVGILRPIGAQYEMIIGTQKLYGSIGAGYDIFEVVDEEPYVLAGIGTERISNTGFGVQVSYSRSVSSVNNYPSHYLSIGLKYDLLRIKKQYRDSKPNGVE